MISVGRNLNRKDIYKKYLDSLARQNYTNFKVIYVDDVSDDDTAKKMKGYIFSDHPEINSKMTIIENSERTYSLGNRDIAIRQYCEENDIVIDFDADD